jgi:hypothetical protein
VYEALCYYCMRPKATSLCGLMLLVYEALVLVYAALSYQCMRPYADEALRY